MNAPRISAVSGDAVEFAVWRTVAKLKIDRIEQSLKDPTRETNGYVFRRFIKVVSDFLEPIKAGLTDALTSAERFKIIGVLDDLALYLRFFESSLLMRAPHPLIDHVQSVFGEIEARAALLLRPQNDQTFETRPAHNSVIQKLIQLAGQWPISFRPMSYSTQVRALSDIFIVSYPKYLGDVFLFYPIFGHEIGHVLYDVHDLPSVGDAALNAQLPLSDSSTPKRRLARAWATELYCDRVGFHIYGEPYIYALWITLLRYPDRYGRPSFQTYVETRLTTVSQTVESVFSELGRLRAADDFDTHLDLARARVSRVVNGFISEDVTDTPDSAYTQYPHPAQRLARLTQLISRDPLPIAAQKPFYAAWREQFISTYQPAPETDEYGDAFRVASLVADKLFARIEQVLPDASVIDGERVAQLVEKLAAWIPPCEVLTQQDVLEPASWQDIMMAAWIEFIDLPSRPGVDLEDWPQKWLAFVYQSFDMNSLYSTFREIAKATEKPSGN